MKRPAQLALWVTVIGAVVTGIGPASCVPSASVDTPAAEAPEELLAVHLTRTAEAAAVQTIEAALMGTPRRPTPRVPTPTVALEATAQALARLYLTQTAEAVPTATGTPTAAPARTPTGAPTTTPTHTPTHTPTPVPPTLPPTRRPPTATPASAPRPAPTLREPPDEASFSGRETQVILKWDSVGSLAEDEYYVVVILFSHGPDTWRDEHWVKETSMQIPDYLPDVATGDRYQWSVTVMRQTGTKPDGMKVGEPLGRASASRSFTWTVAAAPPPSTPTPGSPTPRPLTPTLEPTPKPTPRPPTPTPVPPTSTPRPPTQTPEPPPTPTPEPPPPTPTVPVSLGQSVVPPPGNLGLTFLAALGLFVLMQAKEQLARNKGPFHRSWRRMPGPRMWLRTEADDEREEG